METFYLGLLLVLAVFMICNKLWLQYKKTNSLLLPPGALGFPFIGETFDFCSTKSKGYPSNFISDRVAKYSSHVFKTNIFGTRTIVLAGAAGNKFLFSNENKHVQAWFPESICKLFPYDLSSTMTRMKKFLSLFIKADALRNYVSIMDSVTQKHFSTFWEQKMEGAVFPLTTTYSFSLGLVIFMSIDDPDTIARLLKIFGHLTSGIYSFPINLPGTRFNRGVKATRLITQEILGVIKQRKADLSLGRADSKQDVLSLMSTTCDENGQFAGDLEIATYIKSLLFAGLDSIGSACASTVKYLAELPHIYDRVYKEQIEIVKRKQECELLNWEDIQKMKYSWRAVCEVLRLAPPARGTFREAMNDFEYKGFSIPKGWKLYWSASWTHRNPEYFPEPEKFDPDRFDGCGPPPYTFVPFGGPRMCPGREYSRIAILVFLHNLVKRFKFEKMIPHEQIVHNSVVAVHEKGLPIKLSPHCCKSTTSETIKVNKL